MELIVQQGGRERTVRVHRSAGRLTVAVDGVEYQVDLVPTGVGAWSLVVDGKQYEVGVSNNASGGYEVSSHRGVEALRVLDPLTSLAEKTHDGEGAGGSTKVAAYMPGRVVQVLVDEGDTLAAGQGVLVLEAMKMENEIQVERAGTVKKVYVAQGQAVERGDPLYEID